MSYIHINGNKARLFGNFNQQLLQDLDLELSFKLAGIEFTPAVRMGRYDGRTRLLSSNLSFPIGLVPRVIKFFKQENIDIKVIDNNSYTESLPIDINDKLKELNFSVRDYQLEAVEAAIQNKRGIIRIATGGGKTLIAAIIVSRLCKNKKAMIYVVGKSLLWQFYNLFKLIFGEGQIGIIGDGVCDIKKINISSIWSISLAYGMRKKIDIEEEDIKEKEISELYYSNIRNAVSSSNVTIFDEVHLSAAQTFQKISKDIYSEYCIGMSATPTREDNASLLIEGCFSKIIIDISASELIEKGYLVQPVIKFITIPKVRYPSAYNYRQIYNEYIINNEYRNDLIVKGAISLIEQEFSTVVLFKELQHGKILYDKLNEKKIKFEILSGKDSSDERSRVLDDVMNDKCKLILASSIFNIGIDCKKLSGLINAAAGKSKIIMTQRIGRCIRIDDNKDMAAVIDFYDQCRYLKEHSILRYQAYSNEPGFKTIKSKEMKGL